MIGAGPWWWALVAHLAGEASAAPWPLAVGPHGVHPGVPVVVEAASVDGRAPSDWAAAPTLVVEGADHVLLPSRGAVGRLLIQPRPDAERVALRVGGAVVAAMEVTPPAAPTLAVRSTTSWVDTGEVQVRILGAVRPEHLQVVLGEGRVVAVDPDPDGVVLRLALGDEAYPRVVPIGVRDLSDPGSVPAWGAVRLRARPNVPVTTAPGTRVTLSVGGRSFGPVVVPAEGRVSIPLVQEPEDAVARIVLRDPSGNETRRSFPLASGRPEPVLALVEGAWRDGAPSPGVWLHLPRAAADDPVVCQAPVVGRLPVVAGRDPSERRMVLPLEPPAQGWELRVRCDSPSGGEVTFAVPRAEGVPSALRVRVWPEVLSADLPVADVAVTLENALGERVEPRGSVDITARYGEVVSVRRPGVGIRAEYRGHAVAEVGEDVLTVRWTASAGDGPTREVEVASLGRDEQGRAQVAVRAVDALARPLADVSVSVAAAGAQDEAITRPDGWATLALAGIGLGPQRIALVAEGRSMGAVLVDPDRPDPAGPGRPDLVRDVPVRVDPGRVAEVMLDAPDSQVVPGARRGVPIVARFLDRNGLPAADPRPTLEAPEGVVTGPEVQEDGAIAWTWRPSPGLRPRQVTLVARSEALDLEDEVRVRVAPAPLRRWIGVGAALHSNLGRLTVPRVDLEATWRIALTPAGRSRAGRGGTPGLEVGGGVSWYGRTLASDGLEVPDDTVRMDLIPVTARVAFRQSWPLHAVWVGAGLVVAPWVGVARVDGEVVSQGGGVLSPGVEGTVGYGVRVPGGEIGVHLRASSLFSPGTPESFSGWLGGIAVGATWRVAY